MAKKLKKNSSLVLSREEYLRQLAASKEPLNIKLTNHYAFLKTFKNKIVLKGFLMALLELKEDDIIALEVMDPFEDGENDTEKEGILDIKAHLNSGQKINIEIQNRYQEDWSERTLFYNCRMFVEGFNHGKPYSELEPCIHVGVLDFVQMQSLGFHHVIQLQDAKTAEVYSSKFLFHVIELKKLAETPDTEQNELYRWAKLIAADNWTAMCIEAEDNPYMKAALDEMDKINQNENERYLYLREAMALSDEASRMATARKEGIREGIKQGISQGIQVLINTCREFGISKNEIQVKLEKDFSISADMAKEYIEKFW